MDAVASQVHAAVALLTVAASPHAGKTSLIMALVDQLRDQLNMAVVLGSDATDIEVEKFEATGVPARSISAGGAMEGLSALGLDEGRLDLVIWEVPWEEPCVLRVISAEEALTMLSDGPDGLPAAEAVALNKTDTIERLGARRDEVAAHFTRLWPELRLFLTSATTGAGLESLAQWVLERFSLVS